MISYDLPIISYDVPRIYYITEPLPPGKENDWLKNYFNQKCLKPFLSQSQFKALVSGQDGQSMDIGLVPTRKGSGSSKLLLEPGKDPGKVPRKALFSHQ